MECVLPLSNCYVTRTGIQFALAIGLPVNASYFKLISCRVGFEYTSNKRDYKSLAANLILSYNVLLLLLIVGGI